jgi:hypothetical protein
MCAKSGRASIINERHPPCGKRRTHLARRLDIWRLVRRPSVREFDDCLDLDRGTARQGRGPDCGAHMPARFAEYGDEQIRGAVGHFRMLGELRRRRDEHPKPYDPVYGRNPTVRRGCDLREDAERRRPGGLLALFDVQFRSNTADGGVF